MNVFAVVVPKLESARRSRAELDLKNFRSALKLYRWKMGRFPTTEEGLQSLVDVKALELVPIDPWNRPYGYSNEGGTVELWSLGRDGVRGCESDDLTARAPATP
ncbi:type II secretion system protein GspG [Myxococcus stipitatus]|uniref:type II secretion system protein GspG n=1 Tax=Myxococcus stipitatus TaxID=83455 RepID=UPI001F3259FE|nr:type II secretion system protein GspG [Myxococcus stipitatus]MCE9671575.1 type II secretion system protein GspG [Myxococcus stipitatus]